MESIPETSGSCKALWTKGNPPLLTKVRSDNFDKLDTQRADAGAVDSEEHCGALVTKKFSLDASWRWCILRAFHFVAFSHGFTAKNRASETHQASIHCGACIARKASRTNILDRHDAKSIISLVVCPGLVEAEEVEASARGSAEPEVVGRSSTTHILVVIASINDLPRTLASVV